MTATQQAKSLVNEAPTGIDARTAYAHMNLAVPQSESVTLPSLRPGDWTPTGWGCQHRVRRSDEKWTELVCHTAIEIPDPCQPGPTQRCETARINRDADEPERCRCCASLPDLGPLRYGALGETRRSPEGVLVVCHREELGNGLRWKVIGQDPDPFGHGWRDDWHVASWLTVGNVHGLGGESR